MTSPAARFAVRPGSVDASPGASRSLGRVLGVLLAVAVTCSAGSWAAPPICDSTSALTLLGADTREQRVLFSVPAAAGGAPWMIELDVAAGTVAARRDPEAARRFGGSIGPGPVLAAERCGKRCVQVVSWLDGRWQWIGEELLASDTTVFQAAWDRSGGAWVAFQNATPESGTDGLRAFRLEHGQWRPEGGLSVRAGGSPMLQPNPEKADGITSGDGRFDANGHPEHWLRQLPAAPEAAQGQLVTFDGGVFYFAPDGSLALSHDHGQSWEPVRWQPWSGGEGDLAWHAGREYWAELPEGSVQRPLALVWTDNRVPFKRQLYLTELAADGTWTVLLKTPEGIRTDDGGRLPYNHILRFDSGRWLLLTGCVAGREGSSLAWRELDGGALGPPRLVPIHLRPAGGD